MPCLGDDGDVSSELPTWELVLAAARHLSVTQGEFRLSQLISEVQLIDPARDRGTIQPVVQGMTANAGKGPPSPCGKPLSRVDHGVYRMSGATGGTYRQSESATPSPEPSPERMQPQAPRSVVSSSEAGRILLISCSKAKLDHAAPAQDLYGASPWFRKARRYAERSGGPVVHHQREVRPARPR